MAASAAFCLVSTLSAGIIGTHSFDVASEPNTRILSSAPGSYTSPNYGTFCVFGADDNLCTSGGMSGSYTFADINPTLSRITFSFDGASSSVNGGSFSILLSNLVQTAGTVISGIALNNSNINPTFDFNFSFSSLDATSVTFTGTPSEGLLYFASPGRTAVFDVFLLNPSTQPTPEIPEPATYALMGAGLVSLLAFRRRVSR